MPGQHVVVIGAGSTGSHALPEIARLPGVGRISVVESSAYEWANLPSQHIDRLDVGKPKAEAQAQKLRLIKPQLQVRPMVCRIEDVPLALLDGDVIVVCVDAKLPRQRANEIACSLSKTADRLRHSGQPESRSCHNTPVYGKRALSRMQLERG